MKRNASSGRGPAPAVALAAALLVVLAACATPSINEQSLGLSKTGVFATVTPQPYRFDPDGAPLARPVEGTPPMIRHDVEDDLPITAQANACADCHIKPVRAAAAAIASPAVAPSRSARANKTPPLPADHVVLRGDGAPTTDGRHYACMACHAPQAAVLPLVTNVAPVR